MMMIDGGKNQQMIPTYCVVRKRNFIKMASRKNCSALKSTKKCKCKNSILADVFAAKTNNYSNLPAKGYERIIQRFYEDLATLV